MDRKSRTSSCECGRAIGDGPRRFRRIHFGRGYGRGDHAAGGRPEIKARFLNFNRTSGFIDIPGIGGAQIFRNRFRLREGPGAIDAEHIGGLTSGIHSSLLTDAGEPAQDPILQVFPAWPKDWNTEYRLLAPGRPGPRLPSGRGGRVRRAIASRRPVKLRNPGEAEVTLYRNGRRPRTCREGRSTFPPQGRRLLAPPKGAAPDPLSAASDMERPRQAPPGLTGF